MEYLVFDMDWLDIPLQDLPPVGNLVVCHDPQKRLGAITWAVVEIISEDPPPLAIGLFWEKLEAVRYAKSCIR